MTHAETAGLDSDSLHLGNLAGKAALLGVLLGAAGLTLAWLLGYAHGDRTLFFHMYLVSFVFYLSITLGALFFVLLHHLARAGWSVTVRRLAEGIAGNICLMVFLFLPLLAGLGYLYAWANPEVVNPANHELFDRLIAGKAGVLNVRSFFGCMGVCFLLWILIMYYFRSRSLRQDETGNVKLSSHMQSLAAPAMIVFAGTLTCAAVYLLMSLNAHWSSSMWGVYIFAGSVVSALVVITLLARWLQRAGRLGHAVTTEHYHDLGKLTFAFVFFWGYIAFSQYMLIWYANMPDETQFFAPRQIGPWAAVSLVLVFCHVLIPFAGLLSRNAKRRGAALTFWGVWMLLAHLLDIYWIVMPHYFANQVPRVVGDARLALPEAMQRLVVSNQDVYALKDQYAAFMEAVRLPLEPLSLLVLASLVVGMGGLYVASTMLMLKGKALMPLQDPRLPEALAFENM